MVALVIDIYGFESGAGGLLAGESLGTNAFTRLGARRRRDRDNV